MITKRIIPCLDVKNGRVVKGVNFEGVRDVSSPVELAKYYSDNGADELVFYDITASVEGRALFTDILREVASTIFIPLTVGGGINTLDDFDRVLKCGADKVSVNSGAIRNPGENVGKQGAALHAGGDIIKHQLVGACLVIKAGHLHRICHIPQTLKVSALHHSAVFYIQTGDDSFCQHQPTSLMTCARSRRPV